MTEEYVYNAVLSQGVRKSRSVLCQDLYRPPCVQKLLHIRSVSAREKDMWSLAFEVVVFVLFMISLSFVVYGHLDPFAYWGKKSVEDMVINAQYGGELTLDDVCTLTIFFRLTAQTPYERTSPFFLK